MLYTISKAPEHLDLAEFLQMAQNTSKNVLLNICVHFAVNYVHFAKHELKKHKNACQNKMQTINLVQFFKTFSNLAQLPFFTPNLH